MYTYAWYHWLTFFYLYCFFGWVFESTYVSIRNRRPVNRGFLHLPLIPLYGTGAIMMLWVSLPVKEHLLLVYLSGVVAATLLEYVTGYLMELLFKVKYWDYSDQKYNLNGYICLSSSLAWGFLTILMTEVIHRPIERLVLHADPTAEHGFLVMISTLFLADVFYSVREALDLAKALEAVTRLRGELDDMQVQLALLKAEASDTIQSNVRNFKDTLELAQQEARESYLEAKESYLEAKETRREALEEHKEAFAERREMLERRINASNEAFAEKAEQLRQHMEARHAAILRRNPSASSRRFAAALKELKASIEAKNRK